MAENVVQHAESPSGGIAIAQAARKRKEVEIAIADMGRGIRASLAANPEHAAIPSDVAAVEAALSAFVTATPERNSGIGLFVTRQLLRKNGGTLVVRSGTGGVVSGAREGSADGLPSLPGTLVSLRVRTDRPLDLAALYADLPPMEDE